MAETASVEDLEEDIFHDASAEPGNVLLSSIRDSIVSQQTHNCYTLEIFFNPFLAKKSSTACTDTKRNSDD
jgi:hypothetical protein